MEDLEGCISNIVGTFLIAIAFTLLSGVINLAGISLTFRIILFSFIFILIFIWIIRKGRKIISKDDTLPKKDPLPKVDLFLEEFEKKYPRVNPYMQNFENASADLSRFPFVTEMNSKEIKKFKELGPKGKFGFFLVILGSLLIIADIVITIVLLSNQE